MKAANSQAILRKAAQAELPPELPTKTHVYNKNMKLNKRVKTRFPCDVENAQKHPLPAQTSCNQETQECN